MSDELINDSPYDDVPGDEIDAASEPVEDQPAEEPAIEEPTIEEPTIEEPAIEEPAVEAAAAPEQEPGFDPADICETPVEHVAGGITVDTVTEAICSEPPSPTAGDMVDAAAEQPTDEAADAPTEEQIPLTRRWDEFMLALSDATRNAVWEGGYNGLDDLMNRFKADVIRPRGPFTPAQADEVEAWLLANGGRFQPTHAERLRLSRRSSGGASAGEAYMSPEERSDRQLHLMSMAKNGQAMARDLADKLRT